MTLICLMLGSTSADPIVEHEVENKVQNSGILSKKIVNILNTIRDKHMTFLKVGVEREEQLNHVYFVSAPLRYFTDECLEFDRNDRVPSSDRVDV